MKMLDVAELNERLRFYALNRYRGSYSKLYDYYTQTLISEEVCMKDFFGSTSNVNTTVLLCGSMVPGQSITNPIGMYVLNQKTYGKDLPFEFVKSRMDHIPAFTKEYMDSWGWWRIIDYADRVLNGSFAITGVGAITLFTSPLFYSKLFEHMKGLTGAHPSFTINMRTGITPTYLEESSVLRYSFDGDNWGVATLEVFKNLTKNIMELEALYGLSLVMEHDIDTVIPVVKDREVSRMTYKEHAIKISLL